MNNLYEQSYKWNTVNTGFCTSPPPSIKPLSVSYPDISKKGDEILPSTKILLIKRKWRTALLEVCLFKRTKISIRLPYEKNRLQCLSVYINEDHKSLSCLRFHNFLLLGWGFKRLEKMREKTSKKRAVRNICNF